MKLFSWNVNGLRAVMKKGFSDFFSSLNADIFCLQETKLSSETWEESFPGYWQYFSSSTLRKGYSGTAVFTRRKPLQVMFGIEGKYVDEGRVITLEMENFYLVNAYVPNAQEELKRISYRLLFEQDMREYLQELKKRKPVIYCGDLNVAHQPIDLKNPKQNEGNAGYSLPERSAFQELLEIGLVDVYRSLYPDGRDYSWWSYRFHARERDAGWRIDYFLISPELLPFVEDMQIHKEIYGSDHCPIEIIFKEKREESL